MKITPSGGPGKWLFSYSKQTVAPPQPLTGGSSVSNAEQRLSQKNETISTLRTQLEEQNQTINSLQEQIAAQNDTIEELRTQINATDDTYLNVTVSPANGQQSFVQGDAAVVRVNKANTDISKLSVRYAGNEYTVGGNGRVQIPLNEPGDHPIQFSYEDVSEQVMLDVAAQKTTETSAAATTATASPTATTVKSDTTAVTSPAATPTTTTTAVTATTEESGEIIGNTSTDTDSSDTSAFGTGFTAVVAVIAVIAAALIALRRR